jgi:hypothetical protein
VLTYVPVCGGGKPIVCSSYQQSAIAHGYVDSVHDVTLIYSVVMAQHLNAEIILFF